MFSKTGHKWQNEKTPEIFYRGFLKKKNEISVLPQFAAFSAYCLSHRKYAGNRCHSEDWTR